MGPACRALLSLDRGCDIFRNGRGEHHAFAKGIGLRRCVKMGLHRGSRALVRAGLMRSMLMKLGRLATRWSPLSGQSGTTSGVGASEMDDRALPPTLSNPPLLPIIA